MRIAFYAPMKPPTSPRPSGDRRMARLLMQALASRGHAVELAAVFRSWQGEADAFAPTDVFGCIPTMPPSFSIW